VACFALAVDFEAYHLNVVYAQWKQLADGVSAAAGPLEQAVDVPLTFLVAAGASLQAFQAAVVVATGQEPLDVVGCT